MWNATGGKQEEGDPDDRSTAVRETQALLHIRFVRFTWNKWMPTHKISYVHKHVFIYIYTHTYIHADTYIYICMHMCTCIHACMHTYIHAYMCIYIYIYIYVHTYHTFMCVYIHKYLDRCTCEHTYIVHSFVAPV